ncbi:MAG: SMC-Scp complex subunit ScpB [Ignavibacteriae bacterium HGW-Ignavibacteriae-4]|jgi:segregation and condensation protein B|nr:MAG: SMC-Scp complex subunit ScpB [Ignavibacteriae bacterium HGW-Ignavibacteriae-4]
MELKDLPYFFSLPKQEQKIALEALLFTMEEPLDINRLMKILASNESNSADAQDIIEYELLDKIGFNREYVRDLINDVNNENSDNDRPFRIIESGGGYSLVTSRKYGKIVGKINKNIVRRRLSNANLETIAIIAYRQPISRPGVESIRGVNSKEIINGLIDKGYVRIIGKSDAPGNPYLYGTTVEFLKAFGLNSLEDLPKLKELKELAFTEAEESSFTLRIEMEEDSQQIDNENVSEE